MGIFKNILVIAVIVIATALVITQGVLGLIAGLLLFLQYMQSMLLDQQRTTNALLVEQLLLLTEEDELEECGGDCEQCICGLK